MKVPPWSYWGRGLKLALQDPNPRPRHSGKISICYAAENHKFVITKTYLCNFEPIKPNFYIVKLGLTGVYIIFLISAQKHILWVSLEPPRRCGSNEYPQSMF